LTAPWHGRSSTLDLLVRAGEACLERSAYDRRQIDLLLSAGVYRTEFVAEPAIATLAAAALKINDDRGPEDEFHTLAFDLANGPLGFLNACHVAAGLIKAGRHRRAMILASEIENNVGTSSPQRLGLKETGSAVILDAAPGEAAGGFGPFFFRSFPEYLGDFQSHASQFGSETQIVLHRAAELESHYVACAAAAAEEFLRGQQLDLSRIAAVFPPQISPDFIRRLARAMQADESRFVTVADGSGDLYTSSLPCAFSRARSKQLLRPGDVGLIVSVAPGIQVGCALYYF